MTFWEWYISNDWAYAKIIIHGLLFFVLYGLGMAAWRRMREKKG